MGMFDRVEKGIERAVNGAFAKAFRSEVQPVEIASALRREVDDRATIVARGRTLVPNTFVVELGPADHGRLGEWEDALGDELRDVVNEHAVQQQYAFVGPITIKFEEADDLDTGLFRVRSSTTKGPRRVATPPRQQNQPPGPHLLGGPGPGPIAGAGAVAGAAGALGAPGALGPAASELSQAPAPTPAPAQRRPGTAQASLEVDGRTYRVNSPITVIGRGTEADVMVDDAGVSRRHAEVHTDGSRIWVVDLGSTNGTFVDGERVGAGPQRVSGELSDGSRITVGRTRIVVHFGSW